MEGLEIGGIKQCAGSNEDRGWTRGQDYKEICSMDWCNLRFCAPNLENSEVVTIKKLESVFCAQFEFRTQTTENKSQTH